MVNPEIIIPNNKSKTQSQIRLVWILHFVWNIMSWWILWTLLACWYLFVEKDIQPETKQTIYNIINFNISYYIYMVISIILCVVLIGFVMLLVWFTVWVIVLIIGFIKHLAWDDYEYPLSIKMLK